MVSRRKLRNKKSHSRKSGGKRVVRVHKRTHKHGRKYSGGFKWPWKKQQEQPQEMELGQRWSVRKGPLVNGDIEPATAEEEKIKLVIPPTYKMFVDQESLLQVAGQIAYETQDVKLKNETLPKLVNQSNDFEYKQARDAAASLFVSVFIPPYISFKSKIKQPTNDDLAKALQDLFPSAKLEKL